MCVGVPFQCGYGGVVSLCSLKHYVLQTVLFYCCIVVFRILNYVQMSLSKLGSFDPVYLTITKLN